MSTKLDHEITRQAYRRTDDRSPGARLLQLVKEPIASLPATSVLIKVHSVSLNYRDANIARGGNPWPVLSKGIPGSDAAGEIVGVGSGVKSFKAGDRVTPILDQESITGREQERAWLAADVDGVLADYLVFDESRVSEFPAHLTWDEASTLPCAGLTAWSSLKGIGPGATVYIQGTGGVSMMVLKLARAAGNRVIISSSSDQKLKQIREAFPSPPLLTLNYAKNKSWDEEIISMTGGAGVDCVIGNGGTGSLVQSLRCTKRGGTVSQVGYLGKQNAADLEGLLPLLIDRRINLRGINAGSKHDLEDLYAAVSAVNLGFKDLIDTTFSFQNAEDGIEHIWQGKQVGKVVVQVE